MKKIFAAVTAAACMIPLSACGQRYTVTYGESDIYSEEEMNAAICEIDLKFSRDGFKHCDLHSVAYAGDECNSRENIQWLRELGGKNYTQCIEFVSDFRSPRFSFLSDGAWNVNEEYTDWQWWLARTDGGSWELLTWGY